MITKLRVKKDEDFGSLGLVIAEIQLTGSIVSQEGMVIAHDLIEHQNGASRIGDITDELQACGAIWQVRGRWGDISRSGTNSTPAEDSIVYELTRMAEAVLNGAYVDPVIPRTLSHDCDGTFKHIINRARQEAVMEYQNMDEWFSRAEVLDHYWRACLPNMRLGYRKCDRRFGDRFRSNNQFWAIAEAVDKSIKYIDWYEGQEFILNWGGGKAICEEIDSEY